MTCNVSQEGAVTVFSCTRGAEGPRCVCEGCGRRSIHSCGYQLGGRKAGQSCGRALCGSHGTEFPTVGPTGTARFCPPHARMAMENGIEPTPRDETVPVAVASDDLEVRLAKSRCRTKPPREPAKPKVVKVVKGKARRSVFSREERAEADVQIGVAYKSLRTQNGRIPTSSEVIARAGTVPGNGHPSKQAYVSGALKRLGLRAAPKANPKSVWG